MNEYCFQLTTFCLTASLFTIVATRGTSTTPQYDPWKDLNDDGIIELKDFFEISQIFGTRGDTTKNVAAMYAFTQGYQTFYVEPEPYYRGAFQICTEGYRHITFQMYLTHETTVNVKMEWLAVENMMGIGRTWVERWDMEYPDTHYANKHFEVWGNYLDIWVQNSGSVATNVTFIYYLSA